MCVSVEQYNNARAGLVKKLSGELNDFVANLYFTDIGNVLDKSYEYVIKRDILLAFRDEYVLSADTSDMEDLEYTYKKINSLNSLNGVLGYMYEQWLKREETYMDRLIDMIDTLDTSITL